MQKKQVAPSETVGSLDLGGASTQIAFVSNSKPPSLATSIDFHMLRLFGRDYDVYSHSFLCYGKNEFEKRTMGSVIVKAVCAKLNISGFWRNFFIYHAFV
ncbi:unnamed protein product [Echinostoma caproni]|uniref:Ectonucleoside triphosphate diphosphohydrolase 1 n=1 Tax=Echinostoma caproni TaxID=27848 RepID=A0A183AQ21_9TREM|nr:unnamed protein product [Echinostoma caproni]